MIGNGIFKFAINALRQVFGEAFQRHVCIVSKIFKSRTLEGKITKHKNVVGSILKNRTIEGNIVKNHEISGIIHKEFIFTATINRDC